MIVACPYMGILPDDTVDFTHDESELYVSLEVFHAVGDMNPFVFEIASPGDIRGLIKAGGDLDNDGYLFAKSGCFGKGFDYW